MSEDEYTWKSWLPRLGMDHPYKMLGTILLITVGFVSFFPSIQINTDPEDMLPEDHPVRAQDRTIHDRFFLHDIVAVAIEPPEGKTNFTVEQLERVYDLIERIKKQEGVISQDILSIYTSDDIEGTGAGINVDRLLRTPPDNEKQIQKLLERVGDHPILEGMILNKKSGGLAFFVPVKEKHYSYPVRQSILSFWEKQPESAGKVHITGLPVAESTFGVEMFYQMATSAPMAFVIIGLLMLWFFRSFSLVFWALFQSVITVLWTMGGLIGLGFSVHIMSSMIPIFLLPVAVVDSIHILSDFTDRMEEGRSTRAVLTGVFEEIFFPILFTSFTSAAGFLSLAMTGIPPVQVFGVAVGIGILLAFLMTITVLPAGAFIWTPKPGSEREDSWIARLVECCEDCACVAGCRDYIAGGSSGTWRVWNDPDPGK
ncbi:MAG: RND family transporter [bacterium]